MVEDVEVPGFLHGNELIFTTGITTNTLSSLMDFVNNLIANHAAGLVVNLGPYISKIPPQLVVYCEQHDFPLFSMPWKTRIIDITYHFCRQIIKDEKVEQSLTEAFKTLILEPKNRNAYVATLRSSGIFNANNFHIILLTVKDRVGGTPEHLEEDCLRFHPILTVNQEARAAFVWNNTFVAIYQNTTRGQMEALIPKIAHSLLADSTRSLYVGVSQSAKGYSIIPELYRQAKAAHNVAEMRGVGCCYYEDMGVEKLLLNVRRQDVLTDYASQTLTPLLAYDQEHGSDLCLTLRNYLDSDGGIQNMATTLGMHRNTINNKMKKIKDILGMELTYKQCMELMLAYYCTDILNFKEN